MIGSPEIVLAVLQMTALPLLVGAVAGVRMGWAVRWYAGAVVVGVLAVVAHGLRIPGPALAVAGALLAVAALLAGRCGAARTAPFSGREKVCLLLLVVLLAAPAAAACLHALAHPVASYDGMAIWYAKVKAAYYGIPLSRITMGNYPELGPVLWMLPLKWVGLANEHVGRAFFPLAYFAWMVALPEVFGRPYALPAALAAALSALLVFDYDAFTNGCQDALVLLSAGFAATLLVRLLVAQSAAGAGGEDSRSAPGAASGGRGELVLAGFLSGVPALVKQEGTVWSLIVVGAFLAALVLRARLAESWRLLRAIAPLLAAWIGALALWPALLLWNHLDPRKVQGDGFSLSSIVYAYRELGRWSMIRPYLDTYVGGHRVLLLACGTTSLLCWLLAPKVRRAIAMLWLVLALHLSFLVVVFLSTRFDLAWQLSTAFGRLATQGDFVYVLLAFVSLTALAEAALGRAAGGPGRPRLGLHRRSG